MRPRASEVTALGDALEATGRVRIQLAGVWELWTTTASRYVGDPTQAAALHHALEALAADDRVELPINSWDTSTLPALPKWVKLPANRSHGHSDDWRRFPWCPRLGWVASLSTLSADRFGDLVAIHKWLVSNSQAPIVPTRYRSAEVFGDEKRLDTLARSRLFQPGRLSFELLRCRRLPPPLPAIPVGDGPDILVVENSDPYWAAAEVLSAMTDHPIRAVAWGSGTAFPAQVETHTVDIAGGGPVTGVAWYWGDLDPRGVRVGADAASASQARGGVAILPAAELWSAMATCPPQKVGIVDWTANVPAAGWFGRKLWNNLELIRQAKARVAQESVPIAVIASWARSLHRG